MEFRLHRIGHTPSFRFNSLTGSIDLTEGGLAALSFGEAAATLKFWADGDWFFQAGLQVDFKQAAVEGDLLLGNTKDMRPLLDLDPDVVSFLGDVPKFDGGYMRVGAEYRWIDAGCPLRVKMGAEVGGWYIKSADSFGGKLEGWVSGEGACIVSVKGEISLIGGQIGDVFKLRGDQWVGGGIGWDCDPGSWDSPRDVLHDGGCFTCVIEANCTYTDPDGDLDFTGPDVTCR